MNKETTGIVVSVKKQWWLKVNTKSVRIHGLDGAKFPYVIKFKFTVDGKDYFKRKWIGAGQPIPSVGSHLKVVYCGEKPNKAKAL